MALTNQPYLPLYVQDWLSNNKLKLCSPGAHGLMVNIMCLMHKSDEYGTILLQQKFKQNEQQILNFATMIARLLPFELAETNRFLSELIEEDILKIAGEKLICDRMVKDAELSLTRAIAGSKAKKYPLNNKTFAKEFATAKSEANTENEIANESEDECESKNELKAKKEVVRSELIYPYASEKFMQIWNVFIELPKQRKKPHTSKQMMLKNLSEFDEDFAIKQIELAIQNNWQGLTFSDTKEKYLNSKKGIINHGGKQQTNASKFAELDALSDLAESVVSAIDHQNY